MKSPHQEGLYIRGFTSNVGSHRLRVHTDAPIGSIVPTRITGGTAYGICGRTESSSANTLARNLPPTNLYQSIGKSIGIHLPA